ncbi:MAG: hypothetical protein WBF43_10505 [Methylocella sp.]
MGKNLLRLRVARMQVCDKPTGMGTRRGPRLSLAAHACAGRLQILALAYNPGNFLRAPATPEPIKLWPRNPFAGILRPIAERRPPPVVSSV